MRLLLFFVDTNLEPFLELIRDFYHKPKKSFHQK